MIKITKEKILVKPKDLMPSSELTEIIGTTNPAAIRLPNGDIALYVRVIENLKKYEDDQFFYSPRFKGENKTKIVLDKFPKKEILSKVNLGFLFKDSTRRLTYISYLKRAVLDKTGFNIKSIERVPSFPCLSWDGELGIEDARIVKIGKLYVMTYVALARNSNISTNLAISNDCKKWYRRGVIFEEQNKDVVIFPELINEGYIALNRPEGNFEFSPPHIWISYSKDLENWGRSRPFILAKKGKWDSQRIGAGPPPIKTDKGWLFIYHGVMMKKRSSFFLLDIIKKILHKKTTVESYSVGAVLLDLKNPSKIIAKAENPIISPRSKTEKKNIVKKEVVFPTGLLWDLNDKDLLVYSGGGDEVVTVKKVNIEDIFEKMERVD